MTTLQMTSLTLPTADLGPVNPLPPIQGDASLDKRADLAAASEKIRRQAGYGRVATVLPYLMQDGYSRTRTEREHAAAVLENEYLRATFLPGLGGRLWSLRDLRTGRELLYTNPIVQPANLALRNAWVAGGVEWNIGTIGHGPLTCAPMHTALVTTDDGSPVLRLYEFERLRRVVYQIDVHLPPGSPVLAVYVRISNPNPTEVPMYWWSNMAIPQTADTRVLAPAARSWHYSYDRVLRHDPVVTPNRGAGAGSVADMSYPAHFSDAADFFFDLPEDTHPWIAAVDARGSGMFQASTPRLIGRKLFRWGTGRGGRRWQEWLSGAIDDPAGGYAEIQAGLAATQFEHVPMPPDSVWSWTEAYGALELDAAEAHGSWDEATRAAAHRIRSLAGPDDLGRAHRTAEAWADRAPQSKLCSGSGWGALDRRLRTESGEHDLDTPGTPFDDGTLTADQRPWLELLETGRYPDPPAGSFPGAPHGHPVLRRALAASSGWSAPALLGVAYAADGDWDSACDAWTESVNRADNAYARRHLAIAAGRVGDRDEMTANYRAALRLSDHQSLVVEALDALIEAGEADEARRVIDRLDPALRRVGRVRFLQARAALATGDAERCGEILSDPGLEVADLREGEDSLDALWWQYRAAVTASDRGVASGDEADSEALTAEARRGESLPAHLDFRMKPES